MMTQYPSWRLAKGTLIYGIGGILNRSVNFLLLPVFTSYLTPADYGIFSILGLIGFIVTPVFSLGSGVSMGICYFEGGTQEKKEATLWTTFTMLALSVSVLAALGNLFVREISVLAFQNAQYHYLVKLSLLTTCLTILSMPFGLYFQFEENAKTFVFLTSLSTLVAIGLSFLMVVVLRKGIEGLVESGLIAQSFTMTLFFIPVIWTRKFRFNPNLCREMLRMGVPLIPSFAFLFIIQHGNKYLLQWFWGLNEVGIYNIGFNLGMMMSLIVNGFTNAWTPFFMSFIERKEDASILFGRILTYYVFIFGILSLLFYITAKPVVMIMTTSAFWGAYQVVGFSATCQFLTGVFSILVASLYFAKEVRYVTLTQAITAFITIGLNLIFIPLFGLLGSGIALVLGVLVMNVLQQAWNFMQKSRYLNIQYEWRRIFWFGIIYLGYTVIMLLKRNASIGIEALISCFLLAMLPIFIYALLNQREKEMLWAFSKQLATRLSIKI